MKLQVRTTLIKYSHVSTDLTITKREIEVEGHKNEVGATRAINKLATDDTLGVKLIEYLHVNTAYDVDVTKLEPLERTFKTVE